MEDDFSALVAVRHRVPAIADNHGGGDEREDAVLDKVGGRSRVRDCGIHFGVEFAGAGKGIFRGGK